MDASLSTALVVAGSTLFGAAIGQLGPVVQHWLAAKDHREKLARERFEAMTMACSRAMRAFELTPVNGPLNLTQSRTDLVQACGEFCSLALIYFPDCLGTLDKLRDALMRAHTEMAKGKNIDDDSDAGKALMTAWVKAMTMLRDSAPKYI